MRRARILPYFWAALALCACGGGASVGPAGSLSPTPTPASTGTPVQGTTATPTAVATATATATSTGAATATPTATATASSSALCTDPMSGTSDENWTLSGSSLTITLPSYGTWNGTVPMPANSPSGTVVYEADNQSNFLFAPTSDPGDPAYAARTKDFYMSFRLSQATTFNAGAATLIPISLVSSCLASGTTYYLDTFAGSTFVHSESAVATTGMLTINVMVSPNPFPAGTYINAIVSH